MTTWRRGRASDTGNVPVPASNPLREACYLAGRDVRALLRQPWYVGITLVQPIIWLLLFGQMFSRFADFPASAPRTTSTTSRRQPHRLPTPFSVAQ